MKIKMKMSEIFFPFTFANFIFGRVAMERQNEKMFRLFFFFCDDIQFCLAAIDAPDADANIFEIFRIYTIHIAYALYLIPFHLFVDFVSLNRFLYSFRMTTTGELRIGWLRSDKNTQTKRG